LRRIDKGSAAPTRSADATLPGPPVRRQRSVAARRTAGLSRAEREARIVSLLNRGVAIAEIAAREGLSLKRMRNLVREILAQRMPQPPAES
jgi:DNA-binding CsgD family transcriptional regulator